MRVAYADPPYPGMAFRHYRDHVDYDGEVDHAALLAELATYDGWLLHTSSVALGDVLHEAITQGLSDYRVMAWVKPFAGFKQHVPVAYAWEPVLVKPVRTPVVSGRITMRDFISEPITMRRGLTGVKPERVCQWAFEMLGLEPDDELHDLFPGSGAVSDAWQAWRENLLVSGEREHIEVCPLNLDLDGVL